MPGDGEVDGEGGEGAEDEGADASFPRAPRRSAVAAPAQRVRPRTRLRARALFVLGSLPFRRRLLHLVRGRLCLGASHRAPPLTAATPAYRLPSPHPFSLSPALCWLGDGVGADPAAFAPAPPEEERPPTGILGAIFGGGGSSSGGGGGGGGSASGGARTGAAATLGGAAPGTYSGGAAAVSMRLPQLPLFSLVARVAALLLSCDALRPRMLLQVGHDA